jgi:hypothetical protein
MQPIIQTITAPYSPAAFNALPEFHESKSRFPTRNHTLDGFAEIIRAHGVQKYLGAALIHKHYPLQADERMVEEVKTDGSLLAPRRGLRDDVLTPYLWHLGNHQYPETLQWTPVEFVLSETVPTDVRHFANELPTHKALLNELANLLLTNDAQDTFGLALLHRQGIEFDRDLQILLESPGPDDRTLVVKPVDTTVTASNDWTQTYWHFDVDDKRQIVDCSQHGCAGYCSLHG